MTTKILIIDHERLFAELLGDALRGRFAESEVLVETCVPVGLEKIVYEDFRTIFISQLLFRELEDNTLNELKALFPQLTFIMVCEQLDLTQQRIACRQGVTNFVTRHSTIEQIIEAVVRANDAETYTAPQLQEGKRGRDRKPTRHPEPAKHLLLTRRELDIFLKIGQGSSIQAIAYQFNISTKTVTVHKHRIGKKTGLDNTQKIIRYCMDNGLSTGVDTSQAMLSSNG